MITLINGNILNEYLVNLNILQARVKIMTIMGLIFKNKTADPADFTEIALGNNKHYNMFKARILKRYFNATRKVSLLP